MKRRQGVQNRLVRSYKDYWGDLLKETKHELFYEHATLTFLPEIQQHFPHEDVVCFEIGEFELTLNIQQRKTEMEMVFTFLPEGVTLSMNQLVSNCEMYVYEAEKSSIHLSSEWKSVAERFGQWVQEHPRYRLRFVTGELKLLPKK